MASGTTPLRSRPYPLETDSPDVAADVQLLAVALDTAPVVGQGVLSARPAASAKGNQYLVQTDPTPANNGVLWWDTGTAWVAVNAPAATAARAFYNTGTVTTAGGTAVRIPLNAESFDPGNNFDAVTNFRYVAPSAGIYLAQGTVQMPFPAAIAGLDALLYKNGAQYSVGGALTRQSGNAGDGWTGFINDLVQCIAGDYLELWAVNSVATAATPATGAGNTYLSVVKVG